MDAGLTLVFIDPELSPAEQAEQRLQVRVDHVNLLEDGSTIVHKELTRGLERPFSTAVRVARGGVSLVNDQGKLESQLLPEGFPDSVSSWDIHGTHFFVVGRAAWNGPAILPRDSDPVGIWVEARPAHGLRSRSLYLKGLGEVETLEERPGGAWVCVNLLQQRGYLDVPAQAPTPAPAAKPPTKSTPKTTPKPGPAAPRAPKRSR
ncbi:MAG TPA: hypothetical protein VJ483_00370 [Holophagaceae bacterium]|nr:hypothetical protein [Holophagaceae bacterium]